MNTLTLPRLTISADFRTVALRLLAVVVLCIALSFLSGAFITVGNLVNVLRQAALIFLLASGLTLVILTAGLDLSAHPLHAVAVKGRQQTVEFYALDAVPELSR